MIVGFPNNPRKDLVEEVRWIGESEFDFVDLFLEEDKATPDSIDTGEVKRLLTDYGLDTVGHTPYYLPIGSPSKPLRSAAVQEATRCFEVFRLLDVEFVAIHADWPGGLFTVDDGLKFQIESLNFLTDEAEKYGITLLYEPTVSKENRIENVERVLEAMPRLMLLLDIGHANLNNNKPAEFIERFSDKIRHVHLSDNDGSGDLHLPIGCGKIDWHETLRLLKRYYDGTMTLEIFSSDRNYALFSRGSLKEMWGRV
ncbi:MAG: sugar phosphate isomerase/epimerase [Candidatus Bathyarchaeia archaeon]|nr:sugar phosphate isomerase/epimerase [Candidatus Bathyarchaeota archaeon]